MGRPGVRLAIRATVQQEFLPRVSVEAGYFRRWLQGFFVTDNLSRAASRFRHLQCHGPVGYPAARRRRQRIAGLYRSESERGSLVNNYITRASNFGDQSQTYNGLLINLTARPRNGVSFQGGSMPGKTVTDNCEVRAQLPEISP